MPIIILSAVSGLLSGWVAGNELKKSKKLEFRIPVFTVKNEKK